MDLLQQHQKAAQTKIDQYNQRNKKALTTLYQIKQDTQNNNKKQTNSLLSIFNEINSKQKREELVLTKTNFGSTKLMQETHKTIVLDNGLKGQRVTNTINSINQYSQHLKLTLLKQYRHHFSNGCTRNNSLNQLFRDQTSPIKEEEESLGKRGKKAAKSKQKTKGTLMNKPAYQTLNILYKAIIDGGFKKRQKSSFLLQATQLPIINRTKCRRQETYTRLYKEYTHHFLKDEDKHIENRIPQNYQHQMFYDSYLLRPNYGNYGKKTHMKFSKKKLTFNKNENKQPETQINAWRTQQQINLD